MNYLRKINWKRVFVVVGVLAVSAPFFVGAGSNNTLYVDDNASGTQNGTSSHPYKTITKALNEAKSGTDIIVRKGTYKENIVVPKNVNIIGDNKEKVIIRAKDKKSSVIILKGKARINKVTVEGGSTGIKVDDKGRVRITECKVRNNSGNGIEIQGNRANEEDKVSITDSDIEDNGKNGIYSNKRNISIINNEIENNRQHGIMFERGVRAWIEKTTLEKNHLDGLNLKIANSKIYTEKLISAQNRRNGVEVVGEGIAGGQIDLRKANINNNLGYGVAKIQSGSVVQKNWNSIVIQKNTIFSKNKKGVISQVIKL